MNIIIFGVQRSGTTALYSLIQKVLIDKFSRNKCRFVYEPFLRDPDYFDDIYINTMKKFNKIDSLTAEGIYHHTKIPLLVAEKGIEDNSYIKKILACNQKKSLNFFKNIKEKKDAKHILIKFVKLNGRYRLLDDSCTSCKNIFIIRNPVDVGVSVSNRFSFYGGEFHKDDFKRFLDEVNTHYDKNYTTNSFKNYLDTQLFYWYYMNRFALESFQESKNKPLIIIHEDLINNPDKTLDKILEFLTLENNQKYFDLIQESVGPITLTKEISSIDFLIFEKYYRLYIDLLKTHNIYIPKYHQNIFKKYNIVNKAPFSISPYYGLHSNVLKRMLSGSREVAIERTIFSHIINPVLVNEESDLFIAQPVTFESMKNAKEYAKSQGVHIEQFSVSYIEDKKIVPVHIMNVGTLKSSILDFATFKKPKKLPLLSDILKYLYNASNSEYLIYTNVDIALMPHFYVTLKKILSEGYDAITICRRTISNTYKGVEDLEYMYADIGENHPGTDCFVMKRELVEKFDLQNIAIGCQYVALALRVNLFAFAKNIKEFKKLHMTFHIGDDRTWESLDDMGEHNENALTRIFDNLEKREDTNKNILRVLRKDFENRKERRRNKIV